MQKQENTEKNDLSPGHEAIGDAHFIVGVGASAGGLEAINELFDNIPESNSFSFVVIQHLSPNYKSLMDELLAKHTDLSIVKAEEGGQILPNTIYLIPNKNNMVIKDGLMHLIDKPGSSVPNNAIDTFFTSLADEKKRHAIGIILSGTGSDGNKGVAAIKEKGGMVIVQDPVTAKFDGMPNTAIESGNYDYILPPELMSEEIQRYPAQLAKDKEDGLSHIPYGTDTLQKILRLVRDNTNYDYTYYKRQTLERRINKRMVETGVDSMREYTLYLMNNVDEIDRLSKEFLIGVTSFFRDPLAFEVIQDKVLPELIGKKKNGEQLKIWVAACSTGEEAYTIAILIHEILDQAHKDLNVKIFATDMDQRGIDIAAKGIYSESIENEMSSDRLSKYFKREGSAYVIDRDIRKMVIFAQHNIIKDPPFGKMDMVSCRNMLIYMRPELQKKVLETFHFSLRLNGFLFLGSSESATPIKASVKEINKKWNIYKSTAKSKSFTFDNQSVQQPPSPKHRVPTNAMLPTRHSLESRMKEAFYDTVVEEMGYAAIYVNENYDLLQATGDYKRFIELPDKQLRMSLLKLVPNEMNVPLNICLRRALHDNEKSTTKRVRIGKGQDRKVWSITVKPYLSTHDYEQKFLLILFREEHADETITTEDLEYNDQIDHSRLLELEEELKETKEDLQLTVEELETSNEELQSSNEELLSSNEELQSTNEELQSLNEELHTVNAEHQVKIKELVQLNDDLNNYFSSSDIGQIFVDNDLVIRKYTPAVTDQINLIASDIGRPIHHLSHNINYSDFLDDIKKVIKSEESLSKELNINGESHYLMRIHPYIRQDKSVDGAVIAFIDITTVKKLNNLLEGVLQSSPNVIMAFDAVYEDDAIVDFKCKLANSATQTILKKKPEEIQGKHFLSTFPGFKRGDIFRKLKKVVSQRGTLRQETHYQHKSLNTWLEIKAVPMENGLAITIADLNDKKNAEEELLQAYEDVKSAEKELLELNADLEQRVEERTRALSESENRFRIVAQATNDAVYDWDLVNNQFWWNETFENIFGYERKELAPGVQSLYNNLHPEDAETVEKALNDVINQGEKQWSYEHRFMRSDGSYAFVFNRAYVLHNEYGVPYRVLGAILDISRLKETQEELRKSNENLRSINVDLDNFVYTASHDLKAPITNLESLLGMLKQESVHESERGKFIINKIDSSINKFNETLNALSEITKVQQNQEDTNEHLSIQEVLDDVKEDIKDTIVETQADIHEEIEEDSIYLPKINLRSIIYNLLSNALKYHHPERKPKVHIRTYRQDDKLILEVEDNGLGLTDKQQQKLFTMFKRFHGHTKGTGIGLYMVKRMVENKGGTIEVESHENEGSTFRVILKN